jgi:RNA polymerase sigma factor (sigma-70 family)
VPFEQTLASVKADTASDGDVQSWINTNLLRLERFVDRQLRYRANSGDLPPDTVSREEIIDEVVAGALGEDEKPEKLGLEAWLYRLALRAIDTVAIRDRENVDTVPLEASQRRQNVRASDEPQLQYHQPDEMFTAENVIADRRIATPEQAAASEEMINMVELALLGASAEERDAFILFAVEGFTPEEIAAISDRKVEQIRKDIAKARDRLRSTITMPNEFKDKLLQHSKSA